MPRMMARSRGGKVGPAAARQNGDRRVLGRFGGGAAEAMRFSSQEGGERVGWMKRSGL